MIPLKIPSKKKLTTLENMPFVVVAAQHKFVQHFPDTCDTLMKILESILTSFSFPTFCIFLYYQQYSHQIIVITTIATYAGYLMILRKGLP